MTPAKKPTAALSSKKPDNHENRQMTRKTRKFPFGIFFLIWLLLIGVCLIWYRLSIREVSSGASEVIFVISKGEPTGKIISNLKQKNLIRSITAAKIYLYLSGQTGSLQAGSFRLSPNMKLEEIINQLQHGTLDVWITIPEGWRSEQIVDEIVSRGLLTDIPKSELYQQFRQHEGRLFPDTYLFAKDSSPNLIIQKMTGNFDTKTSSLTNELITLASLVEREAKHQQDRPIIAAVLQNRLDIGMALQVDATLQYAKAGLACVTCATCDTCVTSSGDWWPSVTSTDKSINSHYNTYKYPGLPPGPIANPGLSSIEAVLSPNKVDYLYYVSEPDGTTHYANTLEEHNDNIRKFLR